MKDTVNVKSGGIHNMGKGASKSPGIFGAELNYYSNYHDDKDEGLSTGEAASRATVDTAVDTAIGVGVGMIANWGFQNSLI